MKKFIPSLFAFSLLILVSCQQPIGSPTPIPLTVSAVVETLPRETAVPEQPTVDSEQFTVDSEQSTVNSEQSQPLSDAERTFDELRQNQPLPRDPIALAVAYDGASEQPLPTRAVVGEPLPVGARQSLKVLNIDSITIQPIEAELKAVSDHAYFWFETGGGLAEPTPAELARMAAGFDVIYEQVTAVFGTEANPGIDGDPRIHIVNADPGTLCDDAIACGLLGYFSSSDTVPALYDPNYNEREMFVMNGRSFGTVGYLDTLSHEFRHMVEANYDNGDADWAVEGSATLSQDLSGFPEDALYRGNLFLQNPDQQLNSWPEGNTIPHYGQGYLLNRYLYNRLGPDLYREFATHPGSGLDAVTAVAEQHNLGFDGETLWLDWLTALAIHDHPGADPKYELREGIETAVSTDIQPGQGIDDTVRQYAADYYQITGSPKNVTIDFQGSASAPLIPAPPASGEMMWLANRANYSQAQLTRPLDLSGVDSATLNYKVFHEIEQGYDFAYVAVSVDNACTEPCRSGRSWQPLTAPNMQGLDPAHDPSFSAYAGRFYTSRSGGWLQESIDLTPYAGQKILLRFEYVTDEILTHSGLALDDIHIPEIGFYDDAETMDPAWITDGFIRAAGSIPQPWHIQLITFPDGRPQVQFLPLDETASGVFEFALSPGEQPPILIIAAAAPMTLQPASYTLSVR